MNLLLCSENTGQDVLKISGRRLEHIKNVLKAEKGALLRCGSVNGKIFSSELLDITDSCAFLKPVPGTETDAPPPLSMTLIMTLSRPKSFKKALHAAVSSGIKKIYVINSWKVDKSYWTSPLLSGAGLEEEIILALEQACDTVMPELFFRTRFKPFTEDEIPGIISDKKAFLANPSAEIPCPYGLKEDCVFVTGPEGGFTPYENDMLEKAGFMPVNIGKRILRVEVAIPFITGRLAV